MTILKQEIFIFVPTIIVTDTMKIICAFFFTPLFFSIAALGQQAALISGEEIIQLAQPALNCIQKEYPNKPGNVLGSDLDVLPPREKHPAFYGCFDWHSSVHGHWTLIKLIKEFPDIPQNMEIREKLATNICPSNISAEIQFLDDTNNKTFERTYGWAWLLKLAEEIYTWEDSLGLILTGNIKPLADTIVARYMEFLPKLNYPIRVGEHTNTAFGLSFAWDFAEKFELKEFKNLIESKARKYYLLDKNCPLSWEPGGFDFLSPCLIEADLMSRILNPEEFKQWMQDFLPGIISDPDFNLEPGVVSDRSDGKLVHLDGLNLSRAWCLYFIANKLPEKNERIYKLAEQHLQTALPHVTSGAYEGEHWLASFAVYALFAAEKKKK
ncbi:MAG: DUF2891 domain-containing protein [Bacteroidales bacterium]|nr:DUF2891 domain-containing protein [Bacteroidales bacterium]